MRLSILIMLFSFSFALCADNETEQDEIQERIQPVGKVFVQNQIESESKVVHNKASEKDKASEKESGQEIYEQYCIVCHRDGLAGAPKFRNKQDWKQRLTGKKLDDLLASSIKGVNAMPVKGTCFNCSDEELKAAISYMLPKS
ncbi:MAG: cytochrome c5 family protein [Legionella longbeachae]|nr:cytochrome c5 family protein [Legionella longbeachae]